MGKMEIEYCLSEKGRKVSLLEGGDGKMVQRVDVTEELKARFLALATVGEDGNALLAVRGHEALGYEVEKYVAEIRGELSDEQKGRFQDAYYRRPFPNGRWDYPRYRVQTNRGPIKFDGPQSAELLLRYWESREMVMGDMKAKCEIDCKSLNDSVMLDKKRARDLMLEDVERAVAESEQKARAVRERLLREAKEKAKTREIAKLWIAANGSHRLKLIVEEEMLDDSMSVYMDERLAIERPGWIYNTQWLSGDVEYANIRNSSKKNLDWLRQVRETVEDACLEFASHGSFDDYEYGDMTEYVREPVLTATFLGRVIVLRRARPVTGEEGY